MEEKIAIPLNHGEFSSHFGHADRYLITTLNDKRIISEEFAIPPDHEYGSHPRFLKDIGCNVVITGGLGRKAQSLLDELGIRTIIGVSNFSLHDLIENYIQGTLESGLNRCGH